MLQLPAGFDIHALSDADKLDLIGQLWDSLPDSTVMGPLPQWHQAELEQRLASADANPDAAVPWDEVRQRLRKQP